MNPLNAILVNSAQKLVNALHKQGNDMLGQDLAAIVQLHAIIYALLHLFTLVPKHIPFPSFLPIVAVIAVLWGMYYRINCKLEIPTRKNIILMLFLGSCINLIACYLGAPPDPMLDKDGKLVYTAWGIVADKPDTGGLFYIIIAKLLSFLIMFPLVNFGVKMFLMYIFTYLSGIVYFKVLTFLSEKNKFVRRG